MAEPLTTRIQRRLKFVVSKRDRALLMEARDVLEGLEDDPPDDSEEDPGLRLRKNPGESAAEAFTRITGIKMMPWQSKRLNGLDL